MGISFDFRSEDYGELQHLVDALFAPGVSRYATVTKLDVLMRAEAFDLCADLAEDVQNVYHTMNVTDEIAAALEEDE